MTPDEYCASRVGGAGTSLYYSLLFSAPAQRRGVIAVYAFMHEVGEIALECHDLGVAQAKLSWWHEEVARLYGGAARHPVTRALTPAISTHQLERRQFETVLNETTTALGRQRYPDFAILVGTCQRTGAVAATLVAAILGGNLDAATRRYAETLGVALQLTDILSNIGQDVRRDRLTLPTEDLRRFGIHDTDMFARLHSAAFEELMQFETKRILEYYDHALLQLPGAQRRNQLPGIIMANIARAQLNEMRLDGFRVLERRLVLTPLRKLWIAWRTRLTEQRGRTNA